MFRFRSIVSIRRATTVRYSCGQSSGISVIGVDRCRANHCVSASPARHPPRQHNLKSPLPKLQIRNGLWLRDQASGFAHR